MRWDPLQNNSHPFENTRSKALLQVSIIFDSATLSTAMAWTADRESKKKKYLLFEVKGSNANLFCCDSNYLQFSIKIGPKWIKRGIGCKEL
ncbi:hypothetical protein CEXT_215451 [Caerostris extrusa]|uniref:Uncharacterized protein n=1 Tax=Caerostris extrusa TaxID=172846 RepID=A0AAV4QFT4_CAEEX|nr:hypothetical protein CEXT_215451 [Caerostris extrusa]